MWDLYQEQKCHWNCITYSQGQEDWSGEESKGCKGLGHNLLFLYFCRTRHTTGDDKNKWTVDGTVNIRLDHHSG